MNNRANDFVKNLVDAQVDLRWEKRKFILKQAFPKVAFTLVLIAVVVGCWRVVTRSDKYEQKVQHAAHLGDPWIRFAKLSNGVDPNAWAIAWPNMSQSEQEWALATNTALLEATRQRDPRAIAFITGNQYGSYSSLELFRRELHTTAAKN